MNEEAKSEEQAPAFGPGTKTDDITIDYKPAAKPEEPGETDEPETPGDTHLKGDVIDNSKKNEATGKDGKIGTATKEETPDSSSSTTVVDPDAEVKKGDPVVGKDEDGNIRPYHLGHFFIAIDTDHFLGQELTRKKAGEILRSVRASQKAPGADRIFTAGEKEWEIWQQRKDSGVPINDSVQKEILEVRDELGLTQYKFPWE